ACVRTVGRTSAAQVAEILRRLASAAARGLRLERVADRDIRTAHQADVRYRGQGLRLSVDVDIEALEQRGLEAISERFDAGHKRLFTYALPLVHELATLRAAARCRAVAVA